MIAFLIGLPFYIIGYLIFVHAPRTFWWWVALAFSIGIGSAIGAHA